MSMASVVTRGYSISGGLQAGTAFLPTLGFGSGAEVVVTPTGDPLDCSFRNDGRLGTHVSQRKPGTKAAGRFGMEEQESQDDN